MILSSAVRAYVCAEPIDMRRSIDGLSALVAPLLGMDALSGQVFVFVGKRRNKVKLLVWDRHGFWCLYKRLERGRFTDPRALAASGIAIAELTAWLEGIDTANVRKLAAVNATMIA